MPLKAGFAEHSTDLLCIAYEKPNDLDLRYESKINCDLGPFWVPDYVYVNATP